MTTLVPASCAATAEGTIWEVDANLRPEGKGGPLVRSLASHVAYYERWATTWEFQALLKARFAAVGQAAWVGLSLPSGIAEGIPASLRSIFSHSRWIHAWYAKKPKKNG